MNEKSGDGGLPPWDHDPKYGFAQTTEGVGPGRGVFINPPRFPVKTDLVRSPQSPAIVPRVATVPPETARLVGAQIDLLKKTALLGKYKRFVPVAQVYADMSKLPGTHVGCVILGEGFQVLTSGWNGAPRRSTADVDSRNTTRESRLNWTCHAEANAIANAALSGTALKGGTMVCTLMPCMTCAKLVVQAGIVRVLCPTPSADNDQWGAEFALTRELFKECGIEFVHYDTIGEAE